MANPIVFSRFLPNGTPDEIQAFATLLANLNAHSILPKEQMDVIITLCQEYLDNLNRGKWVAAPATGTMGGLQVKTEPPKSAQTEKKPMGTKTERKEPAPHKTSSLASVQALREYRTTRQVVEDSLAKLTDAQTSLSHSKIDAKSKALLEDVRKELSNLV
jgi:hypothetical protein